MNADIIRKQEQDLADNTRVLVEEIKDGKPTGRTALFLPSVAEDKIRKGIGRKVVMTNN